MTHVYAPRGRPRVVPGSIVLVIGLYVAALLMSWPQQATRQIVAAAAHGPAASQPDHGPAPHAGVVDDVAAPPLWTVLPFVLLLAAIAVLPLLPSLSHWWESNRNRFLVAAGLGLITLLYYTIGHRSTLEGHWPAHHHVEPGNGPL